MHKYKKTIVFSTLAIIVIIVFLSCFFMQNNILKNKTEVQNYEYLSGSGTPGSSGSRIAYNFNYGWRFSKGKGRLNSGTTLTGTNPVTSVTYLADSSNPYTTDFVEGNTWKDVSLPHTFNDEDTFNNYTELGLIGERTMYSGSSWYRKTFNLPTSYEGMKTVYVEFEGARQAAKVWINGNLLTGIYENGFIAFGYELPAEYLNYGDGVQNQNIITVMVDNSYPYIMDGTANSKVSWHDSHWHPNYGGLYRNSWLYAVDNVHLTLPLYSFTRGLGTYVYTTGETSTTAILHIDAEIKNNSTSSKTFTYQAIVKDMNGNVVETIDNSSNHVSVIEGETVTLAPGESNVYSMSTTMILDPNNPTRWSVDYPYLYTCEVQILQNDTIIDDNSNSFGIRTFRITNDYGFYLNEYYTELDGWGQKSTWELAAVGAAYPDWLVSYNLQMLKNAGGNYIRWGHVSGSPSQIKLCDKYGILVNQPGVDGEGESSSGGYYDNNVYRLRTEAMRDMIIYFRNSPSIIMWELGNQSAGLSKTPSNSFLTSVNNWLNYQASDYNNVTTYASVLYDVINKYDYGNRSTTILNSGSYDDTLTSSDRLTNIRRGDENVAPFIDVGETSNATGGMETAKLGNKPNVEAEYNYFEARRGVWDTYTEGFTSFTNETAMQTTDYINSTSESYAIKQIVTQNSILNATNNVGGANWIFSDSISHGRLQSEVARASGEVDAVMLPKQAYYVNQVLNSKIPAIHIIGHWNYPATTVKPVYVVAKNVSRVELFLNGTSLGNGANTNNYLYTFNDVAYEAGTLLAKGYNSSGEEIVRYTIQSHGAPNKIKITATDGPTGLYANGNDILMLDIELLDANNIRCNSYDGEIANQYVDFTYNLTDTNGITGEWLGGYNSGEANNTRTDHLYLEAGITRVFIRTSKNAGDISVTATMNGMSDTYETTTLPFTINNGLTTLENVTAIPALDPSKATNLGSAAKLGAEIVHISNSKLYIENLSYGGTENINNGIEEDFGEGTKIYSDTNYLLTDVPYKYLNSEVIISPNSDRGIVLDDLTVFNVTRDMTIFIARDSTFTIHPNWLSDYTLTDDTIEASNGGNTVTYKIWARDVLAGTSITIGGNSDDGISGLAGANYFVFAKETAKVANNVFFNENFDDFTTSSIINGFNADIADEVNTSITKETKDGRTGLHFVDISSNIAYIIKEFNPLDREFIFEFKAYVSHTTPKLPNGQAPGDPNNWIRTFLGETVPSSYTNMNKLAAETYLFKSTNKAGLKHRVGTTTNEIVVNNSIPTNRWHTYRYYMNPVTQKMYAKVFNATTDELLATTETYDFSRFPGTTINSIGYFTFATGVLDKFASDFYLDDISITPIMDIGVTSVTVNGVILNLTKDITIYNLVDFTSPLDATIDFAYTEDYLSKVVTRYNDHIHVKLVNLLGEEFECDINFIDSVIFDGWTIISYPPNSDISSYIMNNNEVMSFVDSDLTSDAYIHRDIPALETALDFSFDIFLNDDASFNQTDLRIFLTNNAMSAVDDYTNVGVRTYLTPQNATTNEYMMITKKMNDVDSNLMNDTIITKNEWHHFQYLIDIDNNTYSIYMDNNLLFENIPFYNPQTEINHIYIGTDVANTGSFYIKNIAYEEMSGKPIDGVEIDQIILPNFDKQSDEYIYYTDQVLENTTDISLITNAFYVSNPAPIITKDIENQRIVIIVSDNLGNTNTYTIVYADLLDRPITKNQLQILVDHANDDFIANDYTYNTWDVLMNPTTGAVKKAQDVLDDPSAITAEMAFAYYELETAINNLLYLCVYNGYHTSTVETIRYSNNLRINDVDVFSFNKVLANGKYVYNDSQTNTFTSIPYKYMNAEYLLLNNNFYKNGLIVLEPLQNIDILIFKDRDAGPFTEDGFTYTGEIATSSEGVVYKIYSKSFPLVSTNEINIEFDKWINNLITDNNNIVAFINSEKANNNIFVSEDFSIYNETLFERAWESQKSASKADNDFYGDINGLDNYVNMTSTSTQTDDVHGWGIISKEFATLDENIIFKYDINLTSIDSSTKMNKYIRTWLKTGPANYEHTGNEYKSEAVIELYINSNKSGDVGGKISSSGSAAGTVVAPMASVKGTKRYMYNATTTNSMEANIWYPIEVRLNMKARTFKLVYDGELYPSATTSFSMNNLTDGAIAANGPNMNVTSVDHIYFASRFQGPSDFKIRNVEVYHVDSNFYSGITVNGNNISNYKDMTKAYLYEVSDTAAYEIASATPVTGTLFTSNSATSTPTVETTTTGNNKVTNINETHDFGTGKGTYSKDYQVYYEVNTDENTGSGTYGKSDLVDLIKIAQSVDKNYWTSASYLALQEELEYSIARLAKHNSLVDGGVTYTANGITREDDVTYDYLALQTAYNNLQSILNTSFKYYSKIRNNKYYENFEESLVDITTRSSFTGHFNLETRTNDVYPYAGQVHSRFLVSDVSFRPGTKITMIDFSNGNPKMYYYLVTAQDYENLKLRYSLEDFILAGTTDQHFDDSLYNFNQSTNVLKDEYSFIIDFEHTTVTMPSGSHNLHMELLANDVLINEIDSIVYHLYSELTETVINLQVGNEFTYPTEAVNLNLNTIIDYPIVNDIIVTDTPLVGKKGALRVSLLDINDTPMAFPKGSTITYDGITYTVNNNGKFYITRGTDLANLLQSFIITPGYESFPQGSYKIEVEYLATDDGINEGVVLGYDVAEITIEDEPNCSIYAKTLANTDVVYREITNELDFEINTICNKVTEDLVLTVSLYKKDNNILNNFNYTLLDYKSYVNNSITTLYENNIYKIVTHEANNLTRVEYTDSYAINLKSSIPKGLYQLSFDVRSGTIIETDVLNFIVE